MPEIEGELHFHSFPEEQRPAETRLGSQKNALLKQQVDRVCQQCVDTIKLLDGFHSKQLQGSEGHSPDIALVESEVHVLRCMVKEHQESADTSQQGLILKEQARLDQLVQKLETVKANLKMSEVSVHRVEAPQSSVLQSVVARQLHFAAEAIEGKKGFYVTAFPKELHNIPTPSLETRLVGSDLVDGAALVHLEKEVANAADKVLKAERFADQINLSSKNPSDLNVIQEAVTSLKERLGGVETSLAKAAVHFPGSPFYYNLEDRVSLLRAKLDSLEAHYNALLKVHKTN